MKKRLKLLCYLCPALVLTICATVGATTWNRGKASDFVQAQMLKVSVDSKTKKNKKASKDDTNNKEKAEAEKLQNVSEENIAFADGTYEGSAKGYGGKITVSVIIKDGKIASIAILNNNETPAFLSKAKTKVISEILTNQSTNVDTVSGATYSSVGIINAVRNALSKAVVNPKDAMAFEKVDTVNNNSGNGHKNSVGANSTIDATPEIGGAFDAPDGAYRGSGKGFAGRITVEITIKNKTITSIKIVENQGDNDPYFSSAKGVLKEVVSKQSTNVDTVSGATFSSKGMLEAVNNALAKAKSANGNHKNNNSNDKNHGGSASDTTVTDNNTDENKKHIDQKYKDGVYEATVVCGPKNGGAFKPYNLHVKVTIEGGKITDITEINGSGEQYISADSRFISWAVNGKGNEISVVEQIKALKDINNISNGNVDAVSRATYSSKAIVIAVLEAVEQAKVE